jgi:hypothetical protein
VVQKSTFKLTKTELDLISDPQIMALKQKIMRHVVSGLDGLGQWVMDKYYPNSIIKQKVTRGENYLDMPYAVLDVPQLKANDLTGKLRVMIWWGHYISLQLFFDNNDNNLAAIKQITLPNFVVGTSDDLFLNELDDASFIASQNVNKVIQPVSKICLKVAYTELDNLQQHIEHFMNVTAFLR